MPFHPSSPLRHHVAEQRTDLLHRMLLVRHFAEHRAAVPLGAHAPVFRIGEEAAAAGAWAALGTADTMVRADPFTSESAGPAGVSVRFIRDSDPWDAWSIGARPPGLPILVCRMCATPTSPRIEDPAGETVDGSDVEAVVTVARAHLAAVRTGLCAHVIDLRFGVRVDPIAILTARMYADHQLDANALHAIDADAAAHVAAALR